MTTTRMTKSERVYEKLRQRILNGTYRPGGTLTSERQLASEFDITQVTVRRALAQLAEDGLIIKRPHCRTLVRDLPEAITLGVALPRHTSQHHPVMDILNLAIAHEIDPRKQEVHLMPYAPGNFSGEVGQVLTRREAHGLLIWPDATLNVDDVRSCLDAGMQVMLMRSAPQLAELALPCVTIDAEPAFAQLLRRTLELDHQRILITTHTFQSSRERRLRTARDLLSEYGIRDPEKAFIDVPNPPDSAPNYRHLLAALETDPRPTAVIVPNEGDAVQVFRHCFRHGWRIPDDLSLMSVADNTPNVHPVPLSAANSFEMHVQAARQAVQELLQLLSDTPPPARQIALPCRVNWTESLAPPPAG